MALDPLATVADLEARGVTSDDAELALAVASSLIREAAGVPISAVDATVIAVAPVRGTIVSLPGPVSEVSEVLLDGTEIEATEYRNLGNGLWRGQGWGCEPAPVSVTATFGLETVPEDIVELTCTLAKAWIDHKTAGSGSTAGVKAARLDDAAETYTDEAAGQLSAVFLPKETRDWLSARFSGGAFVLETL